MSAPTVATKWVYDFAEGSREMRELLGGKGAGIAEMTRVLGPDLVPAGFTITTEACVEYMRRRPRRRPRASPTRSTRRWRGSRSAPGKRLGDSEDPLLVSVRSGARDSMPGMMDTVLNLGLNDDSVARPRRAHRQRALRVGLLPPARADVRRRRAAACPASASRTRSRAIKRERGVTLDTELDADALRELTGASRRSTTSPPTRASSSSARSARSSTPGWASAPSPTGASTASPTTGARRSTSSRWSSATRARRRAPAWRSRATRSPARPSRAATSCIDAQGEDVVSGVRTPRDLSELRDWMPDDRTPSCVDILRTLERHYGDMQDTEFTIEDGRLYMLQTRNAKRPAQAAVRFAVDAVDEGLLTRGAGDRDDRRAARCDALLHPTFDPDAPLRGRRARRRRLAGRGQGRDRLHRAGRRRGRRATGARSSSCARSPRPTTSPASTPRKGILTSEGGKASHAALVARGMGRPAVTGAAALDDRPARPRGAHRRARPARGRPHRHRRDDRRHHARRRPARHRPRSTRASRRVLGWCDELRTLGVRANADTPEDARRARAFGAEGIGLCRTEHMFMAADRQPKMQRDDHGRRRGRPARRARRAAAAAAGRLRGHVRGDGRACRSRSGCSTRRCTSSCPTASSWSSSSPRRGCADAPELAELEHTLERVRALEEGNPMLGTRGVRLGLIHPEIYEMQARAIFRAARAVRERTGRAPARRDHDPARRLRARARAGARRWSLRVAVEEGVGPAATSASAR